MRRKLSRLVGFLGTALVISTGCSRNKPAPPAPETALAPPPKPATPPREHVPLARVVVDTREGSTVVLARLGARKLAFVADEDDAAIRTLDPTTNEELAVTRLTGRPAQLLVTKEGQLAVAIRDEQVVQILAATSDARAPLDELHRLPTAVEPIALATSPDDATLYVVSGWGHALEAFSLATRKRTFAVDLPREPRAVVASNDGKTAFVAHASQGALSTIDLTDNVVKPAIDLGMSGWRERRRGGFILDFKLDGDGLGDDEPHVFRCGTGMMRSVQFPSRVARQGFALAKLADPKGERVFVPHSAVATGDALVASSGYGGGGQEVENLPTEMFDIDVVDAGKRVRSTGEASKVGIDKRIGPDACRLPRAAVADGTRKSLFVSCLGINRVVEYDASGSIPTATVKRTFDVGAGPNGIALDPENDRAFVWSSFDRVLDVLALGEANPQSAVGAGGADRKGVAKPAAAKTVKGDVTKIAVAASQAPIADEVALGRRLFHTSADPKISRDGRACASCHPDGRDDGLVWSTPDGPRQTIHLAGRVGRGAPFGWLGQHKTLQEHMKITMKNLAGTGVTDKDHDALAAYLGSLGGPPKAKTVALSTEAEHGRELFQSSRLGCSSCHAEKTGYTDLDVHDVSSATEADRKRTFLAPSLRFVSGSAPYFHDGRYASLGDLLRRNEKMGDTKSLSDEDRFALEAFLKTL